MDKDYFIYRKVVPAIKSMTGVKDISLLRKRIKKHCGKIFYHKKYTANDLVGIMCDMGMKRGSVVCIHASMMEFYNYVGTAKQLIDLIIEKIGPEGTLMMPAFPIHDSQNERNFIFDVANDRTGAGHLAEQFRKYPGVKRSYNVRHSVCAIGAKADYLTKDHHCGHDCWDKNSPWYRLCELDGLVFNLGMPRSYIGTFHHCVESILQYEYPYWQQFFNKTEKYQYLKDGQIFEYSELCSDLLRKTNEKNVTRYFSTAEWKISRLSNLEIKIFYSRRALSKMIELGRKGISVYRIPSTKGYIFNANNSN